MSYTYRLIKLMIQKGRTEGLQDKIDLFFAVNRITDAEYQELTELLTPKKA